MQGQRVQRRTGGKGRCKFSVVMMMMTVAMVVDLLKSEVVVRHLLRMIVVHGWGECKFEVERSDHNVFGGKLLLLKGKLIARAEMSHLLEDHKCQELLKNSRPLAYTFPPPLPLLPSSR